MKNYRRYLSLALCMMMAVSMLITKPIFASEINLNSNNAVTYTKDDVMKLKPYIKVENHKYIFDKEAALKAGFPKELVKGQEDFLAKVNGLSDSGKLKINNDLSTTSNEVSYEMRMSCDGKTTPVEYHWWGYSRYLNNCDANEVANNFTSAVGVAGGTAGIAMLFPGVGQVVSAGATFGAGYWTLLASRIQANNHGRGVHVSMTWVLIFDIEPQ